MKKQKSLVGISRKNTIANAQEAKLIARQIVAKIDGGTSALECMEQDTKYAGQITTYRINPETRDFEEIHRECNIRRVSPLTAYPLFRTKRPQNAPFWIKRSISS